MPAPSAIRNSRRVLTGRSLGGRSGHVKELERLVNKVDEMAHVLVLPARAALVHRVGEGDVCVGIGEPERSAGAEVAEGPRARTEAALVSWNPRPKRVGLPRTLSSAYTCSASAISVISGDRMWAPSISPSPANAAKRRATRPAATRAPGRRAPESWLPSPARRPAAGAGTRRAGPPGESGGSERGAASSRPGRTQASTARRANRDRGRHLPRGGARRRR